MELPDQRAGVDLLFAADEIGVIATQPGVELADLRLRHRLRIGFLHDGGCGGRCRGGGQSEGGGDGHRFPRTISPPRA